MDATKTRIGKSDVCLVGLKQAIAELAPTHLARSDEAIANAMLEHLEADNYIPASARQNYAKAVVREFRRATGQPHAEEDDQGLEIKVLGMGCAQCNSLEQAVMEILTELQLPARLDHVTDIQEIARYGVMGVPALLINGRTVAVGRVPARNQIKSWLLEVQATSGEVT